MRTLSLVSLLVGGCGDDAAPTDTKPVAQWETAPPVLGGPVQETAVVALDGKIYVIGGFDASTNALASVRIFDTATSTWSDGAPLPSPINHANAAVVGGTIYVLGGMINAAFTPTANAYAWNPVTDVGWSVRSSMPASTQRGAAITGVIGDKVYVAGGARAGTVEEVSVYSTTNDSWDINIPALPHPSEHACGGVIDGTFYVVGGRYQGNHPSVFAYTPGGAWVTKAPMPTARSGLACGIHDGVIVTAGGELAPNATSVWAEVEAYDTRTDTWSTLTPMATPRHGTGGAVVDGVFYVPGGANVTGFAAVDTHEMLRL
jgi:N-acetylneuraminic acid mutarotase